MKFTCPICETAGNISQDNLDYPVTKATCQNCGSILLINPDTGNVDAHKSAIKDAPAGGTSGSRSTDEPAPVLSMRPQGKEPRDWTAVVVVSIILAALIFAGVYFVVNWDIV
jgi:hypothetical protein